MATISNTPRPGYVWDSADNVWYPIGVGAHQHTNAADTPAVIPYSTYAAAGKNKIINGDFGVWQRGTSFTSSYAFNADRWQWYNDGTGPVVTCSQQTFTPGAAPVSGYEGTYFLRINQTTAGTGTTANILFSNLEDVRLFAGQTITISFWAKAASGTPVLKPSIRQFFSTGGSATLDTLGSNITISTSWTRYSQTINVPSISGKTIAAGNYLQVGIFLPNNAVQTIDLWGIQAEVGSVATAFQTATGNPASELAACQRYYYRQAAGSNAYARFGIARASSTTNLEYCLVLPVTMRVAPTAVEFSTLTTTNAQNVSAAALNQPSTNSASIDLTVGSATANQPYTIMANNSTSAYVAVTAEL